ncbi:MAG: hypothetical protein O7F10_03490 [Deltaproteobacteria bacterium]|nr:hypothetical protein [Deltaproteobacteria bacterium]
MRIMMTRTIAIIVTIGAIFIVIIRRRNGRSIITMMMMMKMMMLGSRSSSPRMIATYRSCSRTCISAHHR